MRTTITIDDSLLEQLKKRAARSGSSVSRLIEESVRLMLHRNDTPSEPKSRFETLTYGTGGEFSTYNIDKAADLLAAEDRERYGDET